MNITLNGKPFTHEQIESVASLLEALEIHGKRVAVMVNDDIVKKDRFAASPLRDEDRVEIIHMVGGG